jgi:hypothetical protein
MPRYFFQLYFDDTTEKAGQASDVLSAISVAGQSALRRVHARLGDTLGRFHEARAPRCLFPCKARHRVELGTACGVGFVVFDIAVQLCDLPA